jgi:hypothetical protein
MHNLSYLWKILVEGNQYKYSSLVYKFMLNSDYTFKWFDYVKLTFGVSGYEQCNILKPKLIDQIYYRLV